MRRSKRKAEEYSIGTARRRKVIRLLQKYRVRFGISSFKYEVRFVRGEKVADYYAEMNMYGKRVTIVFNEDIMDAKPSTIEDTVIHELLHVVMFKLMDKGESIVRRHIRRNGQRKRLINRMEKLEHVVIDKLVPALIHRGK